MQMRGGHGRGCGPRVDARSVSSELPTELSFAIPQGAARDVRLGGVERSGNLILGAPLNGIADGESPSARRTMFLSVDGHYRYATIGDLNLH